MVITISFVYNTTSHLNGSIILQFIMRTNWQTNHDYFPFSCFRSFSYVYSLLISDILEVCFPRNVLRASLLIVKYNPGWGLFWGSENLRKCLWLTHNGCYGNSTVDGQTNPRPLSESQNHLLGNDMHSEEQKDGGPANIGTSRLSF